MNEFTTNYDWIEGQIIKIRGLEVISVQIEKKIDEGLMGEVWQAILYLNKEEREFFNMIHNDLFNILGSEWKTFQKISFEDFRAKSIKYIHNDHSLSKLKKLDQNGFINSLWSYLTYMNIISISGQDFPNTKLIVKRIKLEFEVNDKYKNLFAKETKILLNLPMHSCISNALGADLVSNNLILLFENTNGESLTKYIEKGLISNIENQLLVILNVADGIQFIHDNGIIHRDLKLDNIIVYQSNRQSEDKIRLNSKIIDLGISTLIQESIFQTNTSQQPDSHLHNINNSKNSVNNSPSIYATPGYASPEQIISCNDITDKTDVFSFGIVMIETLLKESKISDDLSKLTFEYLNNLVSHDSYITNFQSIISKYTAILKSYLNEKDYSFSDDLIILIRGCLEMDHSRRINSTDLFKSLKKIYERRSQTQYISTTNLSLNMKEELKPLETFNQFNSSLIDVSKIMSENFLDNNTDLNDKQKYIINKFKHQVENLNPAFASDFEDFQKGLDLLTQERYEEALEKIVKYDNKYHNSHTQCLIGQCLFNLGKYEEATYYLSEYLDYANPKDYQIMDMKACCQFQTKKFADAIESLKKMIEINSENVDPYRKIVSIYESNKSYLESIEWCDKIIKKWPHDLEAWMDKSLNYIHLKKYNDAMESLERTLTTNPDDLKYSNTIAYTLMKQGNYKEAEQCYNRISAAFPNNIEPKANICIIMSKQGKYKEAEECYNKIISSSLNLPNMNNQSLGDLYYNKAIALYHLKKYNEANECLSIAINHNPSDQNVIKFKNQIKNKIKKSQKNIFLNIFKKFS